MTLVELLVAMLIGSIVLAVVGWLFIAAFRGSDRATAKTDAIAQARIAMGQFETDIASARAVDRSSSAGYDPTEFDEAISTDGPLQGYDPVTGAQRPLDIKDITQANGANLVFEVQSSASGTRTPTCIAWRIVNGNLVRQRLAYSGGCDPNGAIQSQAIKLRGDAYGQPLTNVFNYVTTTPSGSNTCSQTLSPTPALLNGIVAVRVDLDSHTSRGQRTQGDSKLTSETPIRSRAGSEYQRALGCTE